ncbi:MAG: hypothetical protein RBR42_12760 [Desulfomicrobium sp.]|nr:hypothetical protein [Desulfomicrobium sp.]
MAKNRYVLLTVDTEALPKRAITDHVQRLMWGKHDQGRAGVAEMAAIGHDLGLKHVFFVDMCGAYDRLEEILEVIRWLDEDGQDVQLHTHPEYLPESFWLEHGLRSKPRYMNQYTDETKAQLVIDYFAHLLTTTTGKPVLAHRAGSFRWNASTIRALKQAQIPLSFNNSMSAFYHGQCVFSEATNEPFLWSNGIIEVPATEKKILPKVGKEEWWARLTYPQSAYFHIRPWWGKFLLDIISDSPDFAVVLLHSWSLLYWDDDGQATYVDDQRVQGYHKFLARLRKDYDVITTPEFLDLHKMGKIKTSHMVDLTLAEVKSKKK